MLQTLDVVELKDGRKMSIRCFTPPEQKYADGFKHFMRFLNDENTRSVGARSDGKYADCSVDRYFIGEINGRIAGQVWYGWGCHKRPVANFGQVYVDLDFRGLGITNILMKYLHADFESSPVMGAMCTCMAPWITDIYRPYGFHQTYPDSPRLYCPGAGSPFDFKDLSEEYYKNSSALRVLPGTMEYRHEIDCLLKFTLELKKKTAQRNFVASAVTSYQDALFKQEDKQGRIFVVLSDDGRCIGWSFCLAPLPDTTAVFLDYELHPDYEAFASEAVKETIAQWNGDGGHSLLAACAQESEKMSVLSDNGFKAIGNLSFSGSTETILMANRE